MKLILKSYSVVVHHYELCCYIYHSTVKYALQNTYNVSDIKMRSENIVYHLHGVWYDVVVV